MTGTTISRWVDISTGTTQTPAPSAIAGTGVTSAELLTYTGTGDGNAVNVTFKNKPRMLIFMVTGGVSLSTSPIVGDDAHIFVMNGGSGGAPTASALFASATVNIDALNTLFSSSIPDINHLGSVYYVWALEAN